MGWRMKSKVSVGRSRAEGTEQEGSGRAEAQELLLPQFQAALKVGSRERIRQKQERGVEWVSCGCAGSTDGRTGKGGRSTAGSLGRTAEPRVRDTTMAVAQFQASSAPAPFPGFPGFPPCSVRIPDSTK